MIHRQDEFKQNSRPNISLLTELTCRGIPKFSETVFFTLVLKLHVVCFKFVDSFCKVTKISAICNSEEETVFS